MITRPIPSRYAPCSDHACDRESGHPGLHMSRTWDGQREVIDEWGDSDLTVSNEPVWSPYPQGAH